MIFSRGSTTCHMTNNEYLPVWKSWELLGAKLCSELSTFKKIRFTTPIFALPSFILVSVLWERLIIVSTTAQVQEPQHGATSGGKSVKEAGKFLKVKWLHPVSINRWVDANRNVVWSTFRIQFNKNQKKVLETCYSVDPLKNQIIYSRYDLLSMRLILLCL